MAGVLAILTPVMWFSRRGIGALAAVLMLSVWAHAGEQPRLGLGRFRVAELAFGRIEPPVVAQSDIDLAYPVSNQRPDPMPLECSGMAWAGDRILVASDRHGHALFSVAVDLAAASIGTPRPIRLVANEERLLDDAESLTVRTDAQGNPWVYVLCSLSNYRDALPLPKRRHMLRCPLSAAGEPDLARAVVMRADRIREQLQTEFSAAGVRPYYAFYKDAPGGGRNTYRWGNVEGMAFVPGTDKLLCGMRNPLVAGEALLFVVAGVDRMFDSGDTGQLELLDVYGLDLGNRGVCDLAWDPVTRGYLIAAARSGGPKLDRDQPYPPNELDVALFWWSGNKQDAPVQFAQVPDMKVEAICRIGSSRLIAIGSDERDESEGREGRQSVLTLLDFTGVVPLK